MSLPVDPIDRALSPPNLPVSRPDRRCGIGAGISKLFTHTVSGTGSIARSVVRSWTTTKQTAVALTSYVFLRHLRRQHPDDILRGLVWRGGTREEVEAAIELGADINALHPVGNSNATAPLIATAVVRGHTELVRILLELGANVNLDRELVEQGRKPPIHNAAIIGHTEILQVLLDAGANLDARDNYDQTPAHHAAQYGEVETLQILAAAGANLDATNEFDETPTHYAAQSGHTEILQVLVDAGANLDVTDNCDQTPAHHAAKWGEVKILQILAAAGANLNATDDSRRTPTHYAARSGHTEILQVLVDSGANLDVGDLFDETPAHCATEWDQVEILEVLAAAGASLDATDECRHTPTHYAAWAGNSRILQFLADAGANMEAVCDEGMTPLHHASRSNRVDAVATLLAATVTIEATDEEGRTPLHLAAGGDAVEVIKALVAGGANLEAGDIDGVTPLAHAVERGKIEAAYALRELGANLECKANDSFTPFLHAVRQGRLMTVRHLSKAGANLHAVTDKGTTAIHLATDHSDTRLLEFLLGEDLDVNAKTNMGHTPLQFAAIGNNTAAIRLLLARGAHLEAVDHKGWTPLLKAASEGNADAVAILVEAGADIMAEREGKNLFDYVLGNGHTAVLVQLAGGNERCVKAVQTFLNAISIQKMKSLVWTCSDPASLFTVLTLLPPHHQSEVADLLQVLSSYQIDPNQFSKALDQLPPPPDFDLTRLLELFDELNFTEQDQPDYIPPSDLLVDVEEDNQQVTRSPDGVRGALESLIENVSNHQRESSWGFVGSAEELQRHLQYARGFIQRIGACIEHENSPAKRAQYLLFLSETSRQCHTGFTQRLTNVYATLSNNLSQATTLEGLIAEKEIMLRRGLLSKMVLDVERRRGALNVHPRQHFDGMLGEWLGLPESVMLFRDEFENDELAARWPLDRCQRNFLDRYYTVSTLLKTMDGHINGNHGMKETIGRVPVQEWLFRHSDRSMNAHQFYESIYDMDSGNIKIDAIAKMLQSMGRLMAHPANLQETNI